MPDSKTVRPSADSPARQRARRSLLALATWAIAGLGLTLAACAGPRQAETISARITLRQFGNGAEDLELRSESHTDRVEYYSTARSDAEVKIMRDDLMEALLSDFDRAGWAEFARPGPGPKSGGSGLSKVIEIERGGTLTHVVSGDGAPIPQRKLMADLTIGFFGAYNAIRSYQTIDDGNDGAIFVGPGN